MSTSNLGLAEEVQAGLQRRREHLQARKGELEQEIKEIDKLVALIERSLGDDDFDHERAAGPSNVRLVEELLVRVGGTATQHEITERSKKSSGTVSHALRALEKRGRIRATGVSVRRSKEYEIVGSTTAPPGS